MGGGLNKWVNWWKRKMLETIDEAASAEIIHISSVLEKRESKLSWALEVSWTSCEKKGT